MLLQLGWIGLVLFTAIAGVALVRSWLDASERRSVIYAWTPLILVALLVDSMFESFTLSGFGWLLLVLCAVRAGQSRSWRERIDARERRGRPLAPRDGLAAPDPRRRRIPRATAEGGTVGLLLGPTPRRPPRLTEIST